MDRDRRRRGLVAVADLGGDPERVLVSSMIQFTPDAVRVVFSSAVRGPTMTWRSAGWSSST